MWMRVRFGERRGSVGRLWQSCWPVDADPAVTAWLRDHRISAQSITSRELARALLRGTWLDIGPRLVIPIYDPWGELTALHAHGVCGAEAVLLGARMAEGMVFANPIARHALAQVARKTWTWRTVILTAGAVDYLQWAAAMAASDDGPAVIGLVDPTWSSLLAARIPEGCRVIVRGDTNPAVAELAPRIVNALRGRCEVIVRTGV
jgi:hypothetical protein